MHFRIAVVDPNVPVREGLAAAIANLPRLEFVGAVRDVFELLDLCRWAEPDAVILSTSARGLGVLRSIRLLRTLFPSLHIAVLGSRSDPVASARCVEAGADAYLDARCSIDTLVSGIAALSRDASSGRRSSSSRNAREPDPLRELTRREVQILECIVRGSSMPEIAREFDLSQRTVREHWTRIRGKLGFSTKADAIAYWGSLHRSDAVPAPEPDADSGLASDVTRTRGR